MTSIPVFRGLVTPEGRVILRETERARRQQWLQASGGRSAEDIVKALGLAEMPTVGAVCV